MTRVVTALAVLVALALGGCGGDDEGTIPRDEADQLIELLREARVQAGDEDRCERLEDLVAQIEAEVAALPNSVDRDTRRTLRDGVDNLEAKAREECEDVETTPTETTPTETETVPPPTETETVPPPTETETEPPPTETDPPAPEPPPDEDGGSGEGDGTGGVSPGQDKKDKKAKNAKEKDG